LYLDPVMEDMKDAAVVSIEIAVKILPGSNKFDFSSCHLIYP
jgi:hypothetical protein